MAEIISTPRTLIYRSAGEDDRVLLDLSAPIINRGAVTLAQPQHQKGQLSIIGLVGQIFKDYERLQPQLNPAPSPIATMILLCELIQCSFQKYAPLHILEVGSQQGFFSYFFTKYARVLHPQSRVCAISADLYDSVFVDMLMQLGDAIDGFGLFTIDTATDMLKDAQFDYAFLNGFEQMPDAPATVRNALRLCKQGAFIACLPRWQSELQVAFEHWFPDCLVYDVDGGESLFVATVHGQHKARLEEYTAAVPTLRDKARLKVLLSELEKFMASPLNDECINSLLPLLGETAELTTRLYESLEDISAKDLTLRLRDAALDHHFSQSEDLRDLCEKNMRGLFNELKKSLGNMRIS